MGMEPVMDARQAGKRARHRGKVGELDVVHLLQEHGWPAAGRTHDGRAQEERGDIKDGPLDCHIEVRYRETAEVWKWRKEVEEAARPDEVPLVFYRRNNSIWLAQIAVTDLLPYLLMVEE